MVLFSYLLVFVICFAISGALFGLTVLLQNTVVKKEAILPFSMPMAAMIPAVAVALIFKKIPCNFSSIGEWKLWVAALVSAAAAALIVQLKKDKQDSSTPMGLLCLEGASMEIVQRIFMQTLILGLLRCFDLHEMACIVINAAVFAADIYVESRFSRERNNRNTAVEAIASFVFSLGIGYVFYVSECFVIPMLAHAAERVMARLMRRKARGTKPNGE